MPTGRIFLYPDGLGAAGASFWWLGAKPPRSPRSWTVITVILPGGMNLCHNTYHPWPCIVALEQGHDWLGSRLSVYRNTVFSPHFLTSPFSVLRPQRNPGYLHPRYQ